MPHSVRVTSTNPAPANPFYALVDGSCLLRPWRPDSSGWEGAALTVDVPLPAIPLAEAEALLHHATCIERAAESQEALANPRLAARMRVVAQAARTAVRLAGIPTDTQEASRGE